MPKTFFINKPAIARYKKQLLADRLILILTISMLFLVIFLSVILAIMIDSSELSLITRYSAYGVTHFYKGSWTYLASFIVFEVMVAVIHPILAIKLLVRGRAFSVSFMLLGMVLIVIGFIYALKVIGIQTVITG